MVMKASSNEREISDSTLLLRDLVAQNNKNGTVALDLRMFIFFLICNRSDRSRETSRRCALLRVILRAAVLVSLSMFVAVS